MKIKAENRKLSWHIRLSWLLISLTFCHIRKIIIHTFLEFLGGFGVIFAICDFGYQSRVCCSFVQGVDLRVSDSRSLLSLPASSLLSSAHMRTPKYTIWHVLTWRCKSLKPMCLVYWWETLFRLYKPFNWCLLRSSKMTFSHFSRKTQRWPSLVSRRCSKRWHLESPLCWHRLFGFL